MFKEKGSKFLSYAFHISNEEQIRIHQEDLRKIHYDARHHCYAWVLGLDHQSSRANDDGEPNHSAGDSILGQIRSFQLTNVLIVVVRYFGGTKLGVGGLINAYKLAAEDALKKARKIEVFETVQLELKFPYEIMSNVERLISDFAIEIIERDFQITCRVAGVLKKDLLDSLKEQTSDLYTLEICLTAN